VVTILYTTLTIKDGLLLGYVSEGSPQLPAALQLYCRLLCA